MKEISCEIVQDLLPLYYDQVCSKETTKLVEDHLDYCESCRIELDRIKTEISLPQPVVAENQNEAEAIKGLRIVWRRSKLRAFVIGILVASLLFGTYVGLTQWQIMKVPSERIKVYEVAELSNGRVVYHAEITDGYALNRIKYDMDEQGNFYLTPLRPIIKTKAESKSLIEIINNFEHEKLVYKEKYGADIKAIYFRSSNEDILIWREGMELKSASEELKEKLRYHKVN
ncbi:zf-HC2 domain-containing protein [Neobacillus mesonae]|nr:zf-HC2 domain-containing protein [Neobacillus mesonae]